MRIYWQFSCKQVDASSFMSFVFCHSFDASTVLQLSAWPKAPQKKDGVTLLRRSRLEKVEFEVAILYKYPPKKVYLHKNMLCFFTFSKWEYNIVIPPKTTHCKKKRFGFEKNEICDWCYKNTTTKPEPGKKRWLADI